MYYLPHSNAAAASSRNNKPNTTTKHTSTSISPNTTSLPSSNSRAWIPYMLNKTAVHQDLKMQEERMSAIVSVLPEAIQNRLPPIPSLTRNLRRSIKTAATVESSTCSSAATATTPPALMSPFSSSSSGRTTPLSEAETAVMGDTSSEPDEVEDRSCCCSAGFDGFAFSDAQSLASSMSMARVSAASETGIDWRCGGQGFSLVLSSAQESRCRHSSNYNSSFERASYVDAVQYMLKGLPRDLDPTEGEVLRRAMPPALAETMLRYHPHGDGNYSSSSSSTSSSFSSYSSPDYASEKEAPTPGVNRNLIHSILLFVLIYLQSWIVWVTPYVLEFSGEILRFERQHKVAEMVMGNMVSLLSAGIQAVRNLSDGPLGQYASSLLEYAAQGVSGALQEFARNEFAKKEHQQALANGNVDYRKGRR